MTKTEFLKIWDTLERDGETRDYQPKDDDIFVKIGGYLFAVQKSGNVIMKKCGESRFTLYEVFRAFRIWLKTKRIQYIRVEGNERRYNFLKKMFPQNSILKDFDEKNRNVFYIKVFD
jgi:hypothetical protein